jgi:hypothetical protein
MTALATTHVIPTAGINKTPLTVKSRRSTAKGPFGKCDPVAPFWAEGAFCDIHSLRKELINGKITAALE